MKLGSPNPLEKCTSQFLDTKVASQSCHMELFDKKFMKSTTFGDHILVYPIRIAAYNKGYPCTVCHIKLWITGPCHVQETGHLTIENHMLHN